MARNAELEARVVELEARLAQNSSNSSRPPSSDPPWTPREKQRSHQKKRKRGGQPGHQGHHREPLPPEKLDAIVDCRPEVCWQCGKPLEAHDQHPVCHQVTELPPLKAQTTESTALARIARGRLARSGPPLVFPSEMARDLHDL